MLDRGELVVLCASMKRTSGSKLQGRHLVHGEKCVAAHAEHVCEHGMPKKEKRARSENTKLARFAVAYTKHKELENQIAALTQ